MGNQTAVGKPQIPRELNADVRGAVEILRVVGAELLTDLHNSKTNTQEEVQAWEALNFINRAIFRVILPPRAS